jgi:hypothetical protein
MLRILTLIIIGLATAGWLWVVATVVIATRDGGLGFGFPVIPITSAVFLIFALPALVLALKRKLLWLALTLALLSLVSVVLVT